MRRLALPRYGAGPSRASPSRGHGARSTTIPSCARSSPPARPCSPATFLRWPRAGTTCTRHCEGRRERAEGWAGALIGRDRSSDLERFKHALSQSTGSLESRRERPGSEVRIASKGGTPRGSGAPWCAGSSISNGTQLANEGARGGGGGSITSRGGGVGALLRSLVRLRTSGRRLAPRSSIAEPASISCGGGVPNRSKFRSEINRMTRPPPVFQPSPFVFGA